MQNKAYHTTQPKLTSQCQKINIMTKPSSGASNTARDAKIKKSTANSQGLLKLDEVYKGSPHDQIPPYENFTVL